MHHLDDECPVERAGQRPGVREPKPGERLSGVSGVPHHEHIIPNHGYPVEADIEVDALALIVVLDECEQACAHIEIVLQAARRQHSRERADRQVSSCPGQIGAHDDMATAAPRRRKLEMGNVKSSWRMPSTPGRGMKSTCPVVSQIPVRRTKPKGGANPESMR